LMLISVQAIVQGADFSEKQNYILELEQSIRQARLSVLPLLKNDKKNGPFTLENAKSLRLLRNNFTIKPSIDTFFRIAIDICLDKEPENGWEIRDGNNRGEKTRQIYEQYKKDNERERKADQGALEPLQRSDSNGSLRALIDAYEKAEKVREAGGVNPLFSIEDRVKTYKDERARKIYDDWEREKLKVAEDAFIKLGIFSIPEKEKTTDEERAAGWRRIKTHEGIEFQEDQIYHLRTH